MHGYKKQCSELQAFCQQEDLLVRRQSKIAKWKANFTMSPKYFRGTIADQSKKVPVVSFEPKLWKRLNQSHENCSTVALVNCNIQEARNRTSGDYEIVASSRTEVTESERQFEIASQEDEQTTIDELCQLAPNSVTSIVAKVTI